MANIIPQNPDINRYLWIDTENLERKKAKEFHSVNVIIGVKYDENPTRLGDNELAIPSGFYKMISNDTYGYKECFFYENIPNYNSLDDSIYNYKVPCSSLNFNYF